MNLKISILNEDLPSGRQDSDNLIEAFSYYSPETQVEQVDRPPGPGEGSFTVIVASVLVYAGKKTIDKAIDVIWDWLKKTMHKTDSADNTKQIKIEVDDVSGNKIAITIKTLEEAKEMIEKLRSVK